jgi:hypothetical protein
MGATLIYFNQPTEENLMIAIIERNSSFMLLYAVTMIIKYSPTNNRIIFHMKSIILLLA